MSSLLRLALIISLLLATLPFTPASAEISTNDACVSGTQQSGAEYLMCVPAALPWNGDLVIYAHGYVSAAEPVGIPQNQLVLPDGTYLPDLITGLGYAFATTSYSVNGLAVLPGIADILDLVDIFVDQYGQPNHIYLGGASEGGLITALAVEMYPQVFTGGLATCGPIGDFRKQTNYLGDFRVVFDAFFPGIIPPSAVNIPQELMDNWETSYTPAIKAALAAKPKATAELLKVTQAPINPLDPTSIEETVLGVLWYNVFATNDAVAKLGGQPFDNRSRWYFGSSNDLWLNWKVKRYSADPAAVAEMNNHYQTTGILSSPLVTLHTTGDPIVPYWHAPLYTVKTIASGSALKHIHIPILRYGHCNFKPSEVLAGFALLVWQTSGASLQNVEAVLPDAAAQEEFLRLTAEYKTAIK